MKVLRVGGSVVAVVAAAGFLFGAAGATAKAQAARPSAARSSWPTYGGNLASQRYAPLDLITKDNFNKLEIAWRLKTDFLGPRPDNLYSATPLFVDGMLYTTAGMRRAVIALDGATGEMRWMHSDDEGVRGTNAPRQGAGRGVAYWAGSNGSDRRVIYVSIVNPHTMEPMREVAPGASMLAIAAWVGEVRLIDNVLL